MAMAHVCPACGAALTRVRPSPDPHYGLPLVLCPSCSTAAVRRRHPLQRRTRRGLQVAKALATFLAQLVVLGALAAVTLLLIGQVEDLTTGLSLAAVLRADRLVLASMGGFCVLTGIWLTVGLSHWRWWAAWAAWAALIAGLEAIVLLWNAPGPPLIDALGVAILPGVFEVGRYAGRLEILAATLVVAAAGIPPGLAVLQLHGTNRRLRWRKRRRRRREDLREERMAR